MFSLFSVSTVFGVDVFGRYRETGTLFDVKLIPGTHDSGLVGITQIYNIEDQLNMGARYFDLKVSPNAAGVITMSARVEVEAGFEANAELSENITRCDEAGKFYICYHSKETFEDVLKVFNAFLQANPGEILFLYIRTDPNTDGTEYKAAVDAILANAGGYLAPEDALSGPSVFVHKPLEQLKGKMVLLHEHDGCFRNGQGQCISWNISDNMEITGLWTLKADEYTSLPEEEREDAAKTDAFARIQEHVVRSPQKHLRGDNGLVTAQVLMLDKSEYPKFRKDICEKYNQKLLEEVRKLRDRKDGRKEVNLGVIGVDGATPAFFQALLALI
jgi:hypothetical protein